MRRQLARFLPAIFGRVAFSDMCFVRPNGAAEPIRRGCERVRPGGPTNADDRWIVGFFDPKVPPGLQGVQRRDFQGGSF